MADEKDEMGREESGALDAARGGRARAEKLTQEQRSDIARKGALARWSPEALPTAQWGSPDRPLRIGEVELPCYVLDDGRRVLIQKGIRSALGMSLGGKSGFKEGDRLARFAAQDTLKPFINTELLERTSNPIKFKYPRGNVAYGYEATVLADLCEAVLAARRAGALLKRQDHIAAQAEILVRGFARTGIIALVDEATGYQDVRARDALSRILEAFIAKELRKWVKTFPADYYKELFRLKGWKFPDLPKEQRKRPVVVGKITNDLIYDRLAPGVRQELNKLTPRDSKGRLKQKLHQRLTSDVGHPKLREHLASVVSLMKAADTWAQFMKMMNRSLPRYDATYSLFDGDY
ncbi:MAG TPA: P63C domain-containing protein [Thermoanaerobaculia bacterium]|jgi:hypothetical protein